jgi:hypothetical protein
MLSGFKIQENEKAHSQRHLSLCVGDSTASGNDGDAASASPALGSSSEKHETTEKG